MGAGTAIGGAVGAAVGTGIAFATDENVKKLVNDTGKFLNSVSQKAVNAAMGKTNTHPTVKHPSSYVAKKQDVPHIDPNKPVESVRKNVTMHQTVQQIVDPLGLNKLKIHAF